MKYWLLFWKFKFGPANVPNKLLEESKAEIVVPVPRILKLSTMKKPAPNTELAKSMVRLSLVVPDWITFEAEWGPSPRLRGLEELLPSEGPALNATFDILPPNVIPA